MTCSELKFYQNLPESPKISTTPSNIARRLSFRRRMPIDGRIPTVNRGSLGWDYPYFQLTPSPNDQMSTSCKDWAASARIRLYGSCTGLIMRRSPGVWSISLDPSYLLDPYLFEREIWPPPEDEPLSLFWRCQQFPWHDDGNWHVLLPFKCIRTTSNCLLQHMHTTSNFCWPIHLHAGLHSSSYLQGKHIFDLQSEQGILVTESYCNFIIPGYSFCPPEAIWKAESASVVSWCTGGDCGSHSRLALRGNQRTIDINDDRLLLIGIHCKSLKNLKLRSAVRSSFIKSSSSL